MAKTLEELLTDVNEFVGTDTARADELATALRERVKIVSQPLINVGAKLGKREQSGKTNDLTAKLQTATEQLETAQEELKALKDRTPNVRDIEENERRKWEPRIKQEKERADKAEQNARKLREQVFEDTLASHLTRDDSSGTRLDNDPLVVRAVVQQYRDRYVLREDGTEDVLQIDNDTPYDGRTQEDKIAALAAAAMRKVNPKFLVTQADNGAGVRNSGNSGVMQSGLKTQDQIIEQRRQDPAFAGL